VSTPVDRPKVASLITIAAALTTYGIAVLPLVRCELRAWERVARDIPDPALRRDALGALSEKALNVEATAVFAILVPSARLVQAVRLMTAYQVMTDYLDTISERTVADPLRNGLHLHRALADALRPGATSTDYYRHHPSDDDGGYLTQLVDTCRERFHALPSATAVRDVAVAAAMRCGAGQSHTHAVAQRGTERIAVWAGSQSPNPDYTWWEIAAGASSSVAIHALLAATADPATTHADAVRVDRAYFPSIGALTVLMDDLVDRDRDAAACSHNYFDYYASSGAAAERIADILGQAEAAIGALRHRRGHAAILAGVLGFYLSAREADTAYARPIKARLLASSDRHVSPILAAMRLRRGLADGSGRRASNPRPLAWEANALPAELRPRGQRSYSRSVRAGAP
jgi:tetraprenyl-beta-curcumene synthase